MESIFILAEAGDSSETGGITAEPLDQTGETTTITTEPGQPTDQLPQETVQKSPIPTWAIMGLMLVMLYFVMFRGPRKKQQQHTQMVKSLSKNDRVQTIGGIIGTVLDIKDDEITLKIDEANNTKIKVTPGSIGKKITKD